MEGDGGAISAESPGSLTDGEGVGRLEGTDSSGTVWALLFELSQLRSKELFTQTAAQSSTLSSASRKPRLVREPTPADQR